MNISEFVQRIKQRNVDLGKLPDMEAAVLLREAFKQIGEDVEATSDGVLKFAGLGQFRVKQVEREKDGVKENIKRTIFLPARPKE